MKVTKLSDRALLIEFPTRKEMNLTCFRISEFSEGLPELKKFYTPDVFIDLMSTKKGNIKYFSYWEGHNIPKKTIESFGKVFKGNVSDREAAVIVACKQIEGGGYVIFAQEGDEITIKHEKAHLYYHEEPVYKQCADALVEKIGANNIVEMNKGLLKEGYTAAVLQDERQAYLTAFDQAEFDEMFPKVKGVGDVVEKLNLLYQEFDK